MMKIEVKDQDGKLILQIEGRLAGAFVAELERCWENARAALPDRPIALDLKDVTCLDRSGRCLLQKMRASGVDCLRAGMALQDLLDCHV